MKLITVTAPQREPITLDEARDQCWLRADTTHDGKLLRLIASARASIEAMTGVRCIQQTVRLELDGFAAGALDLGCYPVQSITTVAYDDADGAAQTLTSGTDFWPDLGGMYPTLAPVRSWPATLAGKPGCVRVTMVVGYPSPADVPPDLRDAILQRVAERFENAGETVTGPAISSVPLSVRVMLAPLTRGVT